LTDWSSVTVSGADRRKFLNSFGTNDVLSNVDCEAFFTNVKGKIVGYGLIHPWNDELVIVGTPNQASRLIEHLDRYIIREDVQLRESSKERVYFHANLSPPTPTAVSTGLKLLTPDSGGLLGVAAEDLPRFRELLVDRGKASCGTAAFESLRIESGWPLFGADFNEENFPQEVNRDHQTISFNKGCYLGQETVARIDALGHVNQKLVGVRFSGTDVPTAGAALSKNDAVVGRVTSAAYSPLLKAPLALAMVRRESNAAGTVLESPVGDCEVISLPLTPPKI
jgi:folate-binding protein YgfZ